MGPEGRAGRIGPCYRRGLRDQVGSMRPRARGARAPSGDPARPPALRGPSHTPDRVRPPVRSQRKDAWTGRMRRYATGGKCRYRSPGDGPIIWRVRGVAPAAACLFVLASLASAGASRATVGGACPATNPNGRVPAGTPTEQYGNGRLATAAYRVILANERTLNPDGSISEKYPWWGAPSLKGELRITGKRLDRSIAWTLHAMIDGGGVSDVPP